MKTIEQMLRYLLRSGVTEFAAVTGRLPCVKMNGAFKPVDDVAPTTDGLLQMLVSAGGSRYVDSLGPKPVQWTMRLDGVGQIAVHAQMRDDVVQARFRLQKRDPRAVEELDADSLVEEQPPPPAQPQGKPGGPRMLSPPPPPPAGVPAPVAVPASAMGILENEPVFDLEDPPSAPRAAPVEVMRTPTMNRQPAPQPPPIEIAPPPSRGGPRAQLAALDLELDLEAEVRASSPGMESMVGLGPGLAGTAALPIGVAMPMPPMPASTPEPTPRAGRYDAGPAAGRIVPQPIVAAHAEPAPESLPPSSFSAAARAPEGAPAAKARLQDLLVLAREARASDLHVVPGRPALLRIAGDLLPRGEPLDPGIVERIAYNLVPGRLHPTLEREGSCDFAITDAHGRCRVNVARQRTGYKVCVRLISREIPTLASLGLPDAIGNATHHHQGLILVTGPTGHGKTSTLAAIVDIVNRETSHHVITVEDPVEYVHPRKRAMMSQREVGTHTKSFASALKGALREDPDVIVVGELRDTETVRMALSASETGHLVIGTMNTPSAAKTIDRLIDLFPPGDQAQVRITLAGGLRLIVSQRLIPNANRDGLVAAAEILPGSVQLWSLIRDNKTYQIPSLQQRGKGIGITRFDDSLAELVKSGRTTLEIAKQWAESEGDLEATVQGKRTMVGNPLAAAVPPKPEKPETKEAPKEITAALFGKAGNLFRKGG